ncbi:8436_t:CDS:10 [Paraglomus brasilianum]|uniref:8436_t:CDS:1 n=1 Tax=Paraglomus brasilianum TaxID=144538 RepID=A0A9N8WIW5_9GLOM|nr:8436_t:CDS:10 [Paraglomus brasilianum]
MAITAELDQAHSATTTNPSSLPTSDHLNQDVCPEEVCTIKSKKPRKKRGYFHQRDSLARRDSPGKDGSRRRNRHDNNNFAYHPLAILDPIDLAPPGYSHEMSTFHFYYDAMIDHFCTVFADLGYLPLPAHEPECKRHTRDNKENVLGKHARKRLKKSQPEGIVKKYEEKLMAFLSGSNADAKEEIRIGKEKRTKVKEKAKDGTKSNRNESRQFDGKDKRMENSKTAAELARPSHNRSISIDWIVVEDDIDDGDDASDGSDGSDVGGVPVVVYWQKHGTWEEVIGIANNDGLLILDIEDKFSRWVVHLMCQYYNVTSFRSNYDHTNHWPIDMSPPPQDYIYDQPASTTSASQPRMANGGPTYNYGYDQSATTHTNTRPVNGISVNTTNLPLSTPTIVNTISHEWGKILCVADVRGNISQLNVLAEQTGATAIIHSGDFENSSLERMSERTLRHTILYSTLIQPSLRAHLANSTDEEIRRMIKDREEPLLSEFPKFLSGACQLKVPVYTVWGACEDVRVLERFRMKEYEIRNLFILDESTSYLIDVGNVNLRLYGLGGAVVPHKLFDNGEGIGTIAGGAGTMWTTILQIGELVDTAQRHYDPTETRVLVTQASPGRHGLLTQLAITLRADFTISAGLHFRYGISYNEFSVRSDQESFRTKLENSKRTFLETYSTIRSQVEAKIDASQKVLLDNALGVINRVPTADRDKEEPAFKNMWNFNLSDAAFGHLLLEVTNGRISAETKAQGFNFTYRRNNGQPTQAPRTQVTLQTPSSPNPSSPILTRQAQAQWQRNVSSPGLRPQNSANRDPSPLRSSSPLTMDSGGASATGVGSNARNTNTSDNVDGGDVTEYTTNSSSAGIATWNESSSDIGQQRTTVESSIDGGNANSLLQQASTAGFQSMPQSYPLGDSTAYEANQTWADQTTNEFAKEDGYGSMMKGNDERDADGQGQQDEDDRTESGRSSSYGNRENRYENQRHGYTAYIGKITPETNEDEIREFFGGDASGIEKVSIPIDSNSQRRKDFAYVDFVDKESCDRALQLDGQLLGGNKLTVNLKKTYSPHRGGYGGGGRRGFGRGRGRGSYNARFHHNGGHRKKD